jgi:ABC-2 type transport system ATP-binding protein
MADVQALCKRIIVIHEGRILFDGALSALGDRFATTKTIGVLLRDPDTHVDFGRFGEVLGTDDGRVTLLVPRADAPRVAARLLQELDVADLTIEDPPIEDVIERVFAGEADATEAASTEAGDADATGAAEADDTTDDDTPEPTTAGAPA